MQRVGTKFLGIAFILISIVGLLFSLGLLSVDSASDLNTESLIDGYFIFSGCLDVIGILFGIGLLTGVKWIYAYLQLIGWLFLLKIPLGTILGVITLFYSSRRSLKYGMNDSVYKKEDLVLVTRPESVTLPFEKPIIKESFSRKMNVSNSNRKSIRMLLRLCSFFLPIPLALYSWKLWGYNCPTNTSGAGIYGYVILWMLSLAVFLILGVVVAIFGFVYSFFIFKK